MKLSEMFDEYVSGKIIMSGGSPNTIRNYENAKKNALKYFGDINVKKLDVHKIEAYYIATRMRVSQDTAGEYLSGLRAVIRFSCDRGVRVMNPDEIIVPKREKKEALFLDENQVNYLASVAARHKRGYTELNRIRNELLVKMLFATGLRISELCSLDRDTIKDRQFFVVGKSKDARPCYITKEVEDMIALYLSRRTDNNAALFISNQNGERLTPTVAQRVFRRISEEAGLKGVHPHTLRHSFGTTMLERGVDIRFVSTMLGHQSLRTTQNYTHVRDSRLRAEYERVMA